MWKHFLNVEVLSTLIDGTVSVQAPSIVLVDSGY